MDENTHTKYLVGVIGAGPAGLYAARELAVNGAHVVLFNRDIRPGGLAEYGIYPDKFKMKEGLRNQFTQILTLGNVDYFGNVMIGQDGDLSLDNLREMGFQALLVTAGAQGTKWLGLPGEKSRGVYHAKDLVYHYNGLPPYSQRTYEIGNRVAIVGVGNVMMDISRYLIHRRHVEEVIALARRGPAEIKFDKNEIEMVGANLDLADLSIEIDRAADIMRSIGQNPEQSKEFLYNAVTKSVLSISNTRFTIQFLLSPRKILADEQGRVCGLEVEKNTLIQQDDEVRAVGQKIYETLEVDTIVFAIGDCVDERLGLPVKSYEFVKTDNPRYPMEGTSYELQDPDGDTPIRDIFVAGWARRASAGLVGIARKDGTLGARAVMRYLQTLPEMTADPLPQITRRLKESGHVVVDKEDITRLRSVEQENARRFGLGEFKFTTNDEMLATIQGSQPRIGN